MFLIMKILLYKVRKNKGGKIPGGRAEPLNHVAPRHGAHAVRYIRRYRRVRNIRLQKLLVRLDRHLPNMFMFLEYSKVDPTNNASERALRCVVVFRKISG